MDARSYWMGAQDFRSDDPETRHRGRVVLLKLALGSDGPSGRRASELLRQEGLIVVKDSFPMAGVR